MEEQIEFIEQNIPLIVAYEAQHGSVLRRSCRKKLLPLFNLSDESEDAEISQQRYNENNLWESMFPKVETFATPTRANGYISNTFRFRTTNSRQLPGTITVTSTHSQPISSSTILNASGFDAQPGTEIYHAPRFSHQHSPEGFVDNNAYQLEYFELPMNFKEMPSIHGPVLTQCFMEHLYPERFNPSFAPNPQNISQEDLVVERPSYVLAPTLSPPTLPEDTFCNSPLTSDGIIINGGVNGNIPRPQQEVWDEFVPNYPQGSDNVSGKTPRPILEYSPYNHSEDDASGIFEDIYEDKPFDLLTVNSDSSPYCNIDNNSHNEGTHWIEPLELLQHSHV